MSATEDALMRARIEAAKDQEDLDSEDESYLENEEIAHRQNMVPQENDRNPRAHTVRAP